MVYDAIEVPDQGGILLSALLFMFGKLRRADKLAAIVSAAHELCRKGS